MIGIKRQGHRHPRPARPVRRQRTARPDMPDMPTPGGLVPLPGGDLTHHSLLLSPSVRGSQDNTAVTEGSLAGAAGEAAAGWDLIDQASRLVHDRLAA